VLFFKKFSNQNGRSTIGSRLSMLIMPKKISGLIHVSTRMDEACTNGRAYLQNREKDERMHRWWSGGGSLRCLCQKFDYLKQEYEFREYRDEKKSVYLGLGSF
jgi:hypothetical protein